MRTTHPNLTAEGCQKFDFIVEKTVAEWIGQENLSQVSRDMMPLPTRLGGLGLFKQETIREIAAGSCFVLCQGVLKARGFPIGDHVQQRMSKFGSTVRR